MLVDDCRFRGRPEGVATNGEVGEDGAFCGESSCILLGSCDSSDWRQYFGFWGCAAGLRGLALLALGLDGLSRYGLGRTSEENGFQPAA
jgi:hypothetical protein